MSMDPAPERPADLGAYLRTLRRARWLSQRAVEQQGGVSNSYLSQIETGRIAQPSPHVLQKLATVYDVPVETLLARAGYIRSAPPVRGPDWPARCARAVVNAPTLRAALAALETLAEGWDMSMDQAPENNLPPPSDDAAPTLDSLWGIAPDATGGAPSEEWVRRLRGASDPAPGTGLRLGGDWTRERDALRKQVEECEDHNTELQGVLAAVRTWAADAQRAATNRLAQGSPDPRYWQAQLDAAKAVWEIVKPVV